MVYSPASKRATMQMRRIAHNIEELVMPIDTPATALVAQLSQAGFRPSERLVKQIMQQGPVAYPALLDLALRIVDLHEDAPQCFGPVHALRLLGDLGHPDMIPALLGALPIPIYTDPSGEMVDVPAQLWAQEVLQIIGRCPNAVEALLALVDDPEATDTVRGSALQGLGYAVTFTGEREIALAAGRERLGREDYSKSLVAAVVNLLADLGDKESYSAIMAAYRSGRVDQTRMPAADARQLLMNKGRPNLDCVKHPLWERYEQHGPVPGAQPLS